MPKTKTSRLLPAALAAMLATCATQACPEVNRLIGPYPDGAPSSIGGAFPNGMRAADDFLLPAGNSANYNVRIVKFVMLSDFPITFSNVGFVVYNDAWNGTYSIPGTLAAGMPNAFPSVRDLGPAFGTSVDYRVYEVTYALPNGFLTLAPNRWYWLSPQATAPSGFTGSAYVATPNTTAIVGAIACRAEGVPPSNTLGPWANLGAICCIGARDLAIYVDAVQIGRALSDFNCDLLLSPQDLFDFLNAWFLVAPTADINGSGDISVQDIFDFLYLWFAGR